MDFEAKYWTVFSRNAFETVICKRRSRCSGVGFTKAPFTDLIIRDYFIALYLTDVSSAELQWHLSNISVVFKSLNVFDNADKYQNN